VSSNKGKSRQRQLARAKYERQLARRAASVRRRRQLLAGLGVLVVVLVAVGAAWLFGLIGADDSSAGDPKNDPGSSQPSDDASPASGDSTSDDATDKASQEPDGDDDSASPGDSSESAEQ
jgi:cytoskeletal protein RodZ